MRVENNVVILEKKDCNCAKDSRLKPGTEIDQFEKVMCPKCKGTGKRGNGRCRNCNRKDGYFSRSCPRTPGYVPNYKVFTVKVCSHCNGNWQNFDDEDLCDDLPVEVLEKLPIRVVRRPNRPITFNESHIGMGTVYSVVDYGRSREWADEQFIEEIRENITGGFPSRQATKYTKRETMELCKEIVVVTSDQGFSAWPRWEE